jgi:hypothetical protein
MEKISKWSYFPPMQNRLVKAITCSILLVFTATVFCERHAQAQEAQAEPGVFRSETVEMVVRAGFGQLELRGWSGTWTPFRIMLANQGEAIIGRLVVLTKNQNGQGREFVKNIQLPTGARQSHEITVYLDSNDDAVISLESKGNIFATTTIPVERRGGASSPVVMAIIDRDSTTLNNLARLEMPLNGNRKPFDKVTAENTPQATQDDSADPSQNNQQNPNATSPNRRNRRGGPWGSSQEPTAYPVVIAPEDMPRDFIAYNSVDVVVLGDAPLSLLNEDQSRALKYWVASGGMLIVTGGADIAGLRAAKFDEILPVEIQGSITTQALTELTDVYGQFDNQDTLVILAAKSKPSATTLLGDGDRALVAEAKYGNGVVRFLAYNPKLNPFRGWSAAKHLWTDLMRPAAETKSNAYMWGRSRNSFSDVHDNLYKMAEIKPTSSTYFLLFLIVYVLAVGPVNYLILRWKKKLDLAWITIPAAVILFTIVSVVIAQFNRAGAVAADSSLVEFYQPEGIQQMRGGFLIRPSSTGKQSVVLDGREFYAIDYNQGGPPTSTENIELEREQGRYNLKIPTTNGAASFFQMRAVSENKKQVITAQELSSTAVRVRNMSESTISNAVYLSSSGVSETFTLAPNEEKQVVLSIPQGVTFTDWYLKQLQADSDEYATFDGLAYALGRGTARTNPKVQGFFGEQAIHLTYKSIDRPMVMGFLDKNTEKIDIEGIAKRRSKAFYVVHL